MAGLKNKLWEAADKLRGSIDAAKYKNMVLGIIFLKYIYDRFEKRYKDILEEGDGSERIRI